MKETNLFVRIGRFYADGFKNMTWGRELWFLIILKVIVLFLILRLFFFKPVLAGKSDIEKSQEVGDKLLREGLIENTVGTNVNNNLKSNQR